MTWSNTKWPAQAQKMARGLYFWIKEEQGLYYPYSKNKGPDQLIYALVFAYADCWFSYVAAYLFVFVFTTEVWKT